MLQYKKNEKMSFMKFKYNIDNYWSFMRKYSLFYFARLGFLLTLCIKIQKISKKPKPHFFLKISVLIQV